MKLFNQHPIHKAAASEIDALHLLHFLADSVKDWECETNGCTCENCPFNYSPSLDGQPTSTCILEAIKDLGFIHLEKNTDCYGNIISEDQEMTDEE